MPPKAPLRRYVKTRAQREEDNAAIRSKVTKRKSPTPPPPSPPEAPATTTTTGAAASVPVQPPPRLLLEGTNPTPSAPPPNNQVDTTTSRRPRPSSAGSASPPNNQVDLPPPVNPNSLPDDCFVHDSSGPTAANEPCGTTSTTDSTAATPAHSIRCKDLVVDPSGGPTKRKRGVVVGMKTKETVRLTGAKIKVEWDDVHNVPADKKIASQMSRDIGMKVKDDVPMVASVYCDLPKEAKGIVYTYMTAFYAIDIEHDGQFKWIQDVAASRYKDWKHDCRRHWEEHRDEVPLEFLKRPREWEGLCKEFTSDQNKSLSRKMKSARKAPTRMNHHSGTTAFVYRAQEHALAGHAAPFVATFKDVYGKDKIGATHVEAMEQDVEQKLNDLRAEQPDDKDGEALPLETQISVITTRIGEGKGTTYRGLGRTIRREPKKRGGVSRLDVDAIVEERVAERVTAVEEKVQEQMKKQEEQHQQQMKRQEEQQQQLKDQMAQIVQQQVEAAVAQALAKFMESQQCQLQEGTPSNVNPSSDS